MIWIVVILGIAAVVGGMLYSAHLAKVRREAFASIANTLGMTYFSGRNDSFDERYPFLNKLTMGSNRYGYNVISGEYRGNEVCLFDYHYETHSTDSKGRRKTHHHYFSFFIMQMNLRCPELVITHENWLSKFAQFFGYDDIDFESAEFSRSFCVRSTDKKFAYDVCNARMIDYLLDHRDLDIEIENHCLTFFYDRCLKPEEIVANLNRLMEVRERIPNYLFTQ